VRVHVDNLIEDCGHLVSHERAAPKQHFPGNTGHRPLVSVVIDLFDHASGLLG
jgi:hypothetical protein